MTDFIQTALMDNIEGRSFLEGQPPIVPPPPPDLGTPTYAISLAPSSVIEGNELVATITTTNVSNSTRLYVTIGSGGSAVSSDFVSSPWSVVIENNKTILRIKPKIDNLIESGETVQLQLRTMSKTGTVVASSNIIGINDIPLPPARPPLPTRTRVLTPVPPPPVQPPTPAPTYSIAVTPITLVESKVNTVYIYTTNVADSTDLYVTLNGAGTATYDDFVAFPLRTTVSNNNASRSVFSVDDGLAETETVQFDLRTGSIAGPVVATTGLLNLQDYVSTQLPKTYTFLLSKVTIQENETFTGMITTTNVPNGTVLHIGVLPGSTATTDDFTGMPTTVTITANRGSFSATVLEDSLSEGQETAQFGLYTDAGLTTLVSASGLLVIGSSGGGTGAAYSVAIVPQTIAEGGTVTATVTTTNTPNGTVLQLTADAFQSAGVVDLVGSPWNVTINGNTGTVNIITAVDTLQEGSEVFKLNLRSTATGDRILATSNPVTITDVAGTATYQLTGPLFANEGTSVTINISTSGVPDGTRLHLGLDNPSGSASAVASDVSGLIKSVTIANNSAVAVVQIIADNLTEGEEVLNYALRTGSQTGPIVARMSLFIADTSVNSPVSYSLVASPTTVGESGTITVNVTTTSVPNGTVLYASLADSGTATAADFAASQWTVVINNNSGSFGVGVAVDGLNEGTETVDFVLKTGSHAGTTVAISNLVNITDSGGGGINPTYSISVTPSIVNEGSSVSGTVTTTNVTNGTTLFVTPTGTGNASNADFEGEPWSVTINENSGFFSFNVTADSTTEGVQTKILHLRTGSGSGPVVAASNVLTINDTSTGGGWPAQYQLLATPISVNEGAYVTLDIRTSDVPANTTLYITVNNPSDYTESQWSVYVMNNTSSLVNQAYVSPQVVADLTTEGPETSTFSLRTGSYSGPVVATATVTINDTSTGSGGGNSTLTFESGSNSVTIGAGNVATATFAISPAMSANGASISAVISALNAAGYSNYADNGYSPMDAINYRLRNSSGFGGWIQLSPDGSNGYPTHNINIPVGTTGIEFSLSAASALVTTDKFNFNVTSRGTTGWAGSQSANHITSVVFNTSYTFSHTLPYSGPINNVAYAVFSLTLTTATVIALDVLLSGVGATLIDYGANEQYIEYSYSMMTPVFHNTAYQPVNRTSLAGGEFTGYITVPRGAMAITFRIPITHFSPLATGQARVTVRCNTVGLFTNSPYSANVNLS